MTAINSAESVKRLYLNNETIEDSTIDIFNESIVKFFKNALKISLKKPNQAIFLLKTLRNQRIAIKTRNRWKSNGIHVPAFLIFSITGRCNLKCKGCYAHAQHREKEKELDTIRIRRLFQEAAELGISMILIAGGEPMLRPELFEITKDFPEIIFAIFTNGTLLDNTVIEKIKKQRNVVPLLSTEGFEHETDDRRGDGIYRKLRLLMDKLWENNIFFGTSLTLTSTNYSLITNELFVEDFVKKGCKVFIYVEYVPVREGTEHLELNLDQTKKIPELMDSLRIKYPSLFVAFPGDEEKLGGCLSSGRGFLHISPEGRIEPCPFAPYSDTNIKDVSLKEALQSKLLLKIRENHDELKETTSGCALWEKREWVKSLL